ncbi:bacteriorhodopsin [soil metagenome]
MNETEQLLHWVYVALLTVSGVVFYLKSKDPKGIPQYKYTIHMFIVFWSALAYAALAMNQGSVNFNGQQVHFARYVDWVVTTPLLLLSLTMTGKLITRKEGWLIATLMGTQAIMILTGLVAELSSPGFSQYFWYTMGCIALVIVLYIFWGPLLAIAKTQGEGIERVYAKSATFLTVQWILYPLVWLIGTPGLQLIGPFWTTVGFLVLPVISKAGFGFYNLSLLRNLEEHDKPAPKPVHPAPPHGKARPAY